SAPPASGWTPPARARRRRHCACGSFPPPRPAPCTSGWWPSCPGSRCAGEAGDTRQPYAGRSAARRPPVAHAPAQLELPPEVERLGPPVAAAAREEVVDGGEHALAAAPVAPGVDGIAELADRRHQLRRARQR